jgi:hypothetical protein
MSAKDKAKELFNKMYHVDDPMGNYPMCFDTAKQCALIAVDEMILVLPFTDTNATLNEYAIHLQKYLDQVKQEIQGL